LIAVNDVIGVIDDLCKANLDGGQDRSWTIIYYVPVWWSIESARGSDREPSPTEFAEAAAASKQASKQTNKQANKDGEAAAESRSLRASTRRASERVSAGSHD